MQNKATIKDTKKSNDVKFRWQRKIIRNRKKNSFIFWMDALPPSQSVKSLGRVWLCDPMDYSTPAFPVHHQLLELTQTHVHQVSDAIQPSHPLSYASPPAFNLSQHQGLFQWVSSHIRWPKYWSFRFSISTSNEYSELISCGINWLDLLAVQGTLKNLPQHHSSKASILWHSAFFTVQL